MSEWQAAKVTWRCSFCGKHQDDVKRIVTAKHPVCICDECVWLALERVDKDEAGLAYWRALERAYAA